jgi:hypothetical protein
VIKERTLTDHPITLVVPDYVYIQAEQVAKATSQPIEEVLRQRLEEAYADPRSRLPLDEQAELDALKHLPDDTLWTIAREQMPRVRQERMHELMDRNSKGAITNDEYEELANLVEQGQRLTLRKAQVADLLMDRGYQVTAKDISLANEKDFLGGNCASCS